MVPPAIVRFRVVDDPLLDSALDPEDWPRSPGYHRNQDQPFIFTLRKIYIFGAPHI